MSTSKVSLGRTGWVITTLVGLLVLGVTSALVWFAFWVTFVDNYELGFIYNRLSGKIENLERTGWIVRTPFVYNVHTIDLRPYQVTISANQRILNAKLVRFNPEGLQTFVEWHGRAAGDSTLDLIEILKCYAFDRDEGRDCPFLMVVSVLAPSQSAQISTNVVQSSTNIVSR